MRARLTLSLLVGIAAATPAAADPIRITSGALAESVSTTADYHIMSDMSGGFSLSGEVTGGNLQLCIPCTPGSPFSLDSVWNLSGDVLFNDIITTATGSFAFTASDVTVPTLAAIDSIVALSRAFTFVGTVLIDGSSAAQQLVGSGTVTVRFYRPDVGSIQPLDIRYDFASPVPEPATILLLGSGLAGAALARQRRRRS
jgi:hypothetical protein